MLEHPANDTNANAEERFEYWQDVTKPIWQLAIPPGVDTFHFSANLLPRHQLTLCDFSFSPMQFRHDPKLIADYDHGYFLLERIDVGWRRVCNADGHQHTRGGFHLIDMESDVSLSSSASLGTSLIIPYDALDCSETLRAKYLSAAKSDLAFVALSAAIEELRRAKDADVARCEDLLLEVVEAAFLGNGAFVAPDRPASSRLVARAFIDAHLANEDLSVEQVCKALGASRASVYRLFAEDGGVRNYIFERRLERCHAELQLSCPRRGLVGDVGERWGFSDTSHFSRRFRDKYGITPGDLACAPLPPTEDAQCEDHGLDRAIKRVC